MRLVAFVGDLVRAIGDGAVVRYSQSSPCSKVYNFSFRSRNSLNNGALSKSLELLKPRQQKEKATKVKEPCTENVCETSGDDQTVLKYTENVCEPVVTLPSVLTSYLRLQEPKSFPYLRTPLSSPTQSDPHNSAEAQ